MRDGARGDTDGLLRAGAIAGGLALTGYGYLATSVRDRAAAAGRIDTGT